MKAKKNSCRFFLFVAVALLLSSCIAERFDDYGDNGKENNINVKFSVQMSETSSPATYAIAGIDENEVRTIDILAFREVSVSMQNPSGFAYAYKARGASITNVSSNKEFTATLFKAPAQQTFVILANVRDELAALGNITADTDKNELLGRLESRMTEEGKWNANTPFPMWSEVKRTIGDGSTRVTGGKFLRSVARVDVVLKTDAIGNFKLEEIYVYNSKSKGRIVPDPANMKSTAKVKAATEPEGDINTAWIDPYSAIHPHQYKKQITTIILTAKILFEYLTIQFRMRHLCEKLRISRTNILYNTVTIARISPIQ